MFNTVLPFAAGQIRCQTCRKRKLGLCAWFDAPISTEIAARSTQAHFSQGASILIQGEGATKVGTILSGLVKIVLNDTNGEEHLIQLLHPGELVGDPSASKHAFSWEAATETELCWLSPATLSAAIQRSPMARGRLVEATQQLLQEQLFARAALRGRNALQRVAHWLFLQMPPERGPGSVLMRVVLCRRDLASLLEMTGETLCRSLHQLEKKGAISLLATDLVEVLDGSLLGLLGRSGEDDHLRETLLKDGWEWGARPVGTKRTPRENGSLPVALGK